VIDTRPTRDCCGLEPTAPVEDALRTIFVLSGRGEPVTTSRLSQLLGVRPSTVSSMLGKLADHGLVERSDEHRATLTPHGERHARHVVRRHRLIETLLVEVLGLAPDAVHREADALEHAVSDALLDRIDDRLGRPRHDPHGDPIPRDDDHEEAWGQRLDRAAVRSEFTVRRVHDWDAAAMRHLAALGIRPGAQLEVLERSPFSGPLWVRVDGRDHALSDQLARLVHGDQEPRTTQVGPTPSEEDL
jgi:DtxR family Mn-dependent transcriptional regulator